MAAVATAELKVVCCALIERSVASLTSAATGVHGGVANPGRHVGGSRAAAAWACLGLLQLALYAGASGEPEGSRQDPSALPSRQ